MTLTLALCLGASEVILRLAPPAYMPLSQTDLELGHVYVPNLRVTRLSPESHERISISINPSGLRDDWSGAADAKPRVMLIGDSYAAAIQVQEDQRFGERAEVLLRERYPKARVLNVAKGGSSAPKQALYLDRFFEMLEPDIVVIAVYNGNDFHELNADNFSGGSRMLTWKMVDGVPTPYRETASAAEKIAFSVRSRIGLLRTALLAKHAYQVATQPSPTTSHPARGSAELACPFFAEAKSPILADSIAIFEEILRRMKARASGRLVLMQIPAAGQVDGSLEGLPDCDPGIPERWLAEFAASDSIPLLQLLPLMERNPGETYYWYHFNYAGHRLAGEALAGLLDAQCRQHPSWCS